MSDTQPQATREREEGRKNTCLQLVIKEVSGGPEGLA
jgi:hypothetical protein